MLDTDLETLPQLIADAAEPLPDIDGERFGAFFDRFINHRFQRHTRFPQLNFAAFKPGYVHHIFDETGQTSNLTLHHGLYLLSVGERSGGLKELKTGLQRRQRIPEFVGQYREKVCFAMFGVVLLNFQ